MSQNFDAMTPLPACLSRRGLLRGAVAATGGAMALLAATAPAEARMTERAASYRDAPKGNEDCANCTLFRAPASCTLVDGKIDSKGWCRFYSKK